MADAGNDRGKLIIPALGGLYESLSPFSYAFMRIATGAVLVPHGLQKILGGWAATSGATSVAGKGLPFPELLAYLAMFAESAAAACLALGLLTRVAAGIIWIEMAVIIVFFQWQFGYFWTARGIEYALLLLLLCTAIFFRGGERLSIDRLIGKEF